MQYRIRHQTRYRYQSEVSVSHHLARLTPRVLPHQRCPASELRVEPKPASLTVFEDYFGNRTTFLSLQGPHRELIVSADSIVETIPRDLPTCETTSAWEQVREQARAASTSAAQAASEFIYPSASVPRGAEYADYGAGSFSPERPVLEALLDLNRRIFADFKFDPRATSVATPLHEVLHSRRGVCQDFAHFEIACLRSLGLPARYVSGYLETKPPPGQPKLVGSDASHAWVQAWCGEPGWIEVDPTNNCLVVERHVTAAWGRDYSDVSPIRGVIVGGGEHELTVAVDVIPKSD